MNQNLSSPHALVADPSYPRLKEHLVESTGLTYYVDKDGDLAQRIGHRLASLDLHNCGSYLDILRDPVRGPSEMDALIAEVTIGETHFFRHREHFDAVRDLVLPDVAARRRANRWMRIWCAGCATGDEPYSLAILLKREASHQVAGWEVTILGTDINRHCLARAREGRFEEWAFRGTPQDLRSDCFSQDGKLWSIAPQYRKGVSFQYHNLVTDPFPSLLNNLSSFDLIFCRNVMIYFGQALMHRIVSQLHDCLVPGGWLLVGPTEPNMTCFTGFQTVNAPGVTLYQKAPLELAPFGGAFEPAQLPPLPPAVVPPAAIRGSATQAVRPTLARVRQHADRGEWETAARVCEELLSQDNLNCTAHFYHAVVLEQISKHAAAERSLRRAIYLDRGFVLAHYHLGLFLQSRGDLRQAARSFENTLELLRPRCDSGAFAEADGITVAELRQLTKMQLETLRERA